MSGRINAKLRSVRTRPEPELNMVERIHRYQHSSGVNDWLSPLIGQEACDCGQLAI